MSQKNNLRNDDKKIRVNKLFGGKELSPSAIRRKWRHGSPFKISTECEAEVLIKN